MMVTADDIRHLNERAFCKPQLGPRGPLHAIPALERLVEHIEPSLVFTDAGGAATWLEYVERAKTELTLAGGGTGSGSSAALD